MKSFARSLLLLSSFAIVGAGCGMDESDDVTATDDALLTCGGWHHGDAGRHRGHRHHRHHHHHHGTGGSGMTTGTGGSGMTTGTAGDMGTAGTMGTAGDMGTAGTTGTGGSGGGMIDPRCADVDGMISWWHGDGDYDDAVGANDGATDGAVAFGPGADNLGFRLNGTMGSDVPVPNDPSLMVTTAFTMDAWINPTELGGRIIDKASAFGGDGYMMDSAGQWLRLFIGGDQLVSVGMLPVGMFTHVAATYDGATLAVYLNGALDNSKGTFMTSIVPNTHPLHIGADSNGGSLLNG